MSNSNNKQSRGLISNAFGIAKKVSSTGFQLLNQVAPETVSKLTHKPDGESIIQGSAMSISTKKSYDNPQSMMRDHIPLVSQQLLGRHYNKFNKMSSFISPELNEKLAEYFFDKLNDFVSDLSSVDGILKEIGAKDLSELAKDPARSGRISFAFENQNKAYAIVQGILTGFSGVLGSAIDVPTSIALALHSIYQTGRAYGFELKVHEEQEIVEFIFKRIDLGTVAEKQALLVAVRTLSGVLENHDMNQLQTLLGSQNDIDLLKKWISNDDGSLKWNWINQLPQISILSKLTPLVGAGVGAYFSLKLLDDASKKAQFVFSESRGYLNAHPEQKLDILDAFEQSQIKISGLLEQSAQNDEISKSEVIDEVPEDVSDMQKTVTESKVEATQTQAGIETETAKEELNALESPKKTTNKRNTTKKVTATESNESANASIESKEQSVENSIDSKE